MIEKLKKDPIAVVSILVISIVVLLGFFAPQLAPNDPDEINMALKFSKASLAYPFGNDYLGRCVFSRILYGIQPSVLLVIGTMLAINGIGLIVGLLAGYFKGWIDEILMRVCDIILSFPPDAMVLASIGIFGIGLKNILLTMIFLRWPWYARVFRIAIMKYTDKNYIRFAQATGDSTIKIVFKHVIPSVIPEIMLIASSNISLLILSVSGFSFLGVGIEAPKAEWGMMLSEARSVIVSHPEQLLAPGVFIVVVCVAFSFLGDALRDAMDAKHIQYSLRRKDFSH